MTSNSSHSTGLTFISSVVFFTGEEEAFSKKSMEPPSDLMVISHSFYQAKVGTSGQADLPVSGSGYINKVQMSC